MRVKGEIAQLDLNTIIGDSLLINYIGSNATKYFELSTTYGVKLFDHIYLNAIRGTWETFLNLE